MKKTSFHPFFISVLSVSFLLTIAIVLEVLLRHLMPWAVSPPEDKLFLERYRVAWSPTYLIENRSGKKFLVRDPREREAMQILPMEKTAGVLRIAIVGESSAVGLAQSMQDFLFKNGVADRFEIMNFAIGGASLELAQRKFREALRCSPDMVVFLFGHNLYVPYATVSPWIYRFRSLARRSVLLSRLSIKLRGNPYEYIDAEHRLAEFEKALGMIVRQTKKMNVPVTFCTVPSNLMFPPKFAAEDIGNPGYWESLYLFATEGRQAAIRELQSHLRRNSSAIGHFRLGEWLLLEGETEQARYHLETARDLDPDRNRATASVNAAVRKTATETGSRLFDIEEFIKAQAPRGIPSWESIQDQHHVWTSLYYREALELLRLWRKTGWLSSEFDELALPKEPLKDFALAGLLSELTRRGGAGTEAYWFEAAARRFAHILQGPDQPLQRELKTQVLDLAPTDDRHRVGYRARLIMTYARAHWDAGQRSAAFLLLDQIRRETPPWEEPDVWQGLWRLELGNSSAAETHFREALRKNPARRDAHYFLQRLLSDPNRP